MQLKDLTFEKDFNLKIIALVRGKKITNPIGVSILEHRVANEFTENLVLDKDDQLVCYGSYKNFMSLWKTL